MSWYLVECREDESLSVIPGKDVQTVKGVELCKGDAVKFYFGKRDRIHEARILNIGSDEQFDDLVKEMNDLNKRNKVKKDSFHEEAPRKSAVKMKQMMHDLVQGKKGKDAGKKNSSSSALSVGQGTSYAGKAKQDDDSHRRKSKSQNITPPVTNQENISRGEAFSVTRDDFGITTSLSEDDDMTEAERTLIAKIKAKKAAKKIQPTNTKGPESKNLH